MRFIALAFVALLLSFAADAQACSPNAEYVNKPLSMKVDAAELVFIGTVDVVGPDFAIFRIGTPGKGAPAKGEKLRVEHKNHGTCGRLDLQIEEVWLYVGPLPFSGSQQIDAGDAEAEIAAVVKKIESQPDTP